MRILVSAIVLLFISSELFAQSFYGSRRQRTAILTVGTGTTSYFGDLNDPGDRFDAQPNVNIGLAYYVNSRVSLRGEVTWFQLRGNDEDADTEGRRVRNLSFRSNNFEMNFIGIVDLFEHGRRFYQRRDVNPYIFAGIGLTYFNPTAEYQGQRYSLRDYQTENVDYSPMTVVFPYGLGIKYKASPFFNIGLEVGYRHTLTDYLDDVSTVYVDKSGAPPIEQALADRRPEIGLEPLPIGNKRGNPENNDGYAIINIKLEYYLPGDLFGTNQRSLSRPKRRRR